MYVAMEELILGTHNPKKLIELQQLLAPYPLVVRSLSDFEGPLEVVEDGDSFSANAQKKASQQAIHLNAWVIGEDSGLVVPALKGAPGIYSARYSGPSATDASNNEKLLSEMDGLEEGQRGGHYVSHISLADPAGKIRIDCEARCYGRIGRRLVGSHGFGYDPLFVLPEYHRTFGQLGPSVKSILSHRARAMRRFLPQLLRFVG